MTAQRGVKQTIATPPHKSPVPDGAQLAAYKLLWSLAVTDASMEDRQYVIFGTSSEDMMRANHAVQVFKCALLDVINDMEFFGRLRMRLFPWLD